MVSNLFHIQEIILLWISQKAEAYSWNNTRSYKVLRKNEKEVATKCHMKNLMRKKYVLCIIIKVCM